MANSSSNFVQFENGSKMPAIGLGTYQIRDFDTIYEILDAALDAGYRMIDTAQVYGNEEHIGTGLVQLLPKYGLTRSDIFITSKLSPANQGLVKCEHSVIESLKNLKTDHIDLFLIHWPGVRKVDPNDPSNRKLRTESWTAMEKLCEKKILTNIGVSNYTVKHLEELLAFAKTRPAVNQCEFHPHYADLELVNFCQKHSIHFQAYSSFGSPKFVTVLFSKPVLLDLSKRYGCSVANLLLAWALHQGISVLPRSQNAAHVRDNLLSKNVKISDEHCKLITETGNGQLRKYCWDPRVVE